MAKKRGRPKKEKKKKPELVYENIFDFISKSKESHNQIAQSLDITPEELNNVIKDYHESLEKRLEFDKTERKELFKSFKKIEKALEEIREEAELTLSLDSEIEEKKDYCLVNIGGKWLSPKPEKLNDFSEITQKDYPRGNKNG